MTDVYVSNYDPDSMYRCYLGMDSRNLLEEYQAVRGCLDILNSGSTDLCNSYMAEFADSLACIMRDVIVERYVEMMKVEQSNCKVVRLVDCVG